MLNLAKIDEKECLAPRPGEYTPSRGDSSPTKDELAADVTLKDLRKCLDEDKPPTDDKEDIGTDKDAIDYSVNSSLSDDEERAQSETPSPSKIIESPSIEPSELVTPQKRPEDNGDITFDDIEDVISNPYGEMPEFYPKQLEFDPVEGLPGNQRKQLEHKKKTVLKNKYWDRVLKNVYDMATAKVPRPTHLTKMLSLYLINQQKIKGQRKEQLEEKPVQPDKKAASSLSVIKRQLVVKLAAPKKNKRDPTSTNPTVSRRSSNMTPSMRAVRGLSVPATNAASNEVQKRLEKLDKNNIKISTEDLARDTKNLLVRMPPYKRKEMETFSSADIDTTYTKLLTKYIFTHGFIQKWKGESIS